MDDAIILRLLLPVFSFEEKKSKCFKVYEEDQIGKRYIYIYYIEKHTVRQT